MDEPTNTPTDSTAGASEPVNPPAGGPSGSGSGDDGATGGTQVDVEGAIQAALSSALEPVMGQVRGLQSRLDKVAAGFSPEPEPSSQSEPQAQGGMTEERMVALIQLSQAGTDPGLREKYAKADAELFTRALSFESREAFETALEQSHNREATREQTLREQIEADVLAKYGINAPKPGPSDSGSTGGDSLTPDRLAQMTPDQLQALHDRIGPAAYDELMRSAY